MKDSIKWVEIVIPDGIAQCIQQMAGFVRDCGRPDYINDICGHAPPVVKCFVCIGFFLCIPDTVLHITDDTFIIFSPVPCRKCQVYRCFTIDPEQSELAGDIRCTQGI